jgi:hypothetical protein
MSWVLKGSAGSFTGNKSLDVKSNRFWCLIWPLIILK